LVIEKTGQADKGSDKGCDKGFIPAEFRSRLELGLLPRPEEIARLAAGSRVVHLHASQNVGDGNERIPVCQIEGILDRVMAAGFRIELKYETIRGIKPKRFQRRKGIDNSSEVLAKRRQGQRESIVGRGTLEFGDVRAARRVTPFGVKRTGRPIGQSNRLALLPGLSGVGSACRIRNPRSGDIEQRFVWTMQANRIGRSDPVPGVCCR